MSGRDFELFYDGACPLCLREVRWLRGLDRAQRIRFTDIAEPAFDPSALGKEWAELMARIHGRLPDGTWVEGVEAFRRTYEALGFRRLVSISRLPGVSQALTLLYHWFAKNRLRLTGRCHSDVCGTHGSRAGNAIIPGK